MPRRFLYPWFALLVLGMSLVGCQDDPEPTLRVQLNGELLDMSISDRWELESSSDESRVYLHQDFENVRLHLSSLIENIGQPLRVPHVKALIGKELNLRYGGVSTRVSLGGNAMIKYTRTEGDEGEPMRREEWVIAKPVGYGDIARVELSLRIPPDAQGGESILALIDTLDKQVGDARIPRD